MKSFAVLKKERFNLVNLIGVLYLCSGNKTEVTNGSMAKDTDTER